MSYTLKCGPEFAIFKLQFFIDATANLDTPVSLHLNTKSREHTIKCFQLSGLKLREKKHDIRLALKLFQNMASILFTRKADLSFVFATLQLRKKKKK